MTDSPEYGRSLLHRLYCYQQIKERGLEHLFVKEVAEVEAILNSLEAR